MNEVSSKSRLEWDCVAKSVVGASHARRAMPGQDASGFVRREDTLIVALADGHGGENYDRSDVGARLAVAVGLAVFEEFHDRLIRSSQGDINQAKNLSQIGQSMVSAEPE